MFVPLKKLARAVRFLRARGETEAHSRSFVVERQFVCLDRLFDDLLEAGQLHLGRMTLALEQIDLRRLVEDVVESVRPRAIVKCQTLEVYLPAETVWMEADPVRLQQVVSNLLVNGIKYTQPGGRVSIDLARRFGDAVLTVRDTGRGITADLLPHVFEPFIRAADAPDAGLGVGLAIARQIVELHGGTIGASSAGAGNGSEFVVTLRARPPNEPYSRGANCL